MRLPLLLCLPVLALPTLSACMSLGSIAASDRTFCLAQGHQENTAAYDLCRRNLEAERQADLTQLRTAADNAEPTAVDILNRQVRRTP